MIKSHAKLSDAEFAQAKEAFMIYDKEGNDKLETKEIGQLLRALGMTPTFVQVREITREFDKNKTGFISFNDFIELYATHKVSKFLFSLWQAFLDISRVVAPPASSKELLEAFKAFDKKGTGFIPSKDLQEALTSMGDPLPAVQVKELLAALDKGDGRIDVSEFVAFLTK